MKLPITPEQLRSHARFGTPLSAKAISEIADFFNDLEKAAALQWKPVPLSQSIPDDVEFVSPNAKIVATVAHDGSKIRRYTLELPPVPSE